MYEVSNPVLNITWCFTLEKARWMKLMISRWVAVNVPCEVLLDRIPCCCPQFSIGHLCCYCMSDTYNNYISSHFVKERCSEGRKGGLRGREREREMQRAQVPVSSGLASPIPSPCIPSADKGLVSRQICSRQVELLYFQAPNERVHSPERRKRRGCTLLSGEGEEDCLERICIH